MLSSICQSPAIAQFEVFESLTPKI